MKKQLKDYLHLYLGCEYILSNDTSGQKAILKPSNLSLFPDVIKPILRPLSDMTDDEMKECGNLVYDFRDEDDLNVWKWQDFQFGTSEQFQWLLSKHFDLFELIEAGLAIDATKIKSDERIFNTPSTSS